MNSPGPDAPDDSDHLLIARTLAGEQRAYGLLVLKYQRRVQRLVSRMVRDAALVEDITQEAFIRAYRALPQFRGEAHFYTWLYRIAVNTAKKSLLELRRDAGISAAMPAGEDEGGTFQPKMEPSTGETPESLFAAREIAKVVNTAMDELPEDLRQALSLREIEGLSYEEIAVAMNCPVGTVRSRIFRARDAISARVKPMLDKQTGGRW